MIVRPELIKDAVTQLELIKMRIKEVIYEKKTIGIRGRQASFPKDITNERGDEI